MKKRERRTLDNPKLEMTPMIDCVFQLLIFFIITLKIEDILSHLDISRPAPDPQARPEEKVDLLEIMVYNPKKLGGDGFSLKGRKVSAEELERQLSKLATYSKTVSVVIKCTGDSPHSNLIILLNICAKVGLTQLSVFSV